MIILNLKLRNFRNYENLDISFGKGMNVITGKNAQGKTNLLESMIYLSLTRSHRISDDKRLIKEGESYAHIRCDYEDEYKRQIEAVIYPKGKTLLVRKQPVKRSSEFIGLLNVILFAPDDLRMFIDPPKERRRVMNQEITKVSPRYLLSLNQYQNLLKNRNLLLKSNQVDLNLLDTLDEQMAKEEVLIIKSRNLFVKSLQEVIPTLYQKISDTNISLQLKYKCCLDEVSENEQDLYESLLKMHQDSRKKDLEYKVTSVGIHHEDLEFMMDDQKLVFVASQGQKRMAMLAFKLSLLAYIKKETGKKPILLLDDVLSELDEHRQKKLLDMVNGPYQCFITATEVPEYLKYKNIQIYEVDHGSIELIQGGKE